MPNIYEIRKIKANTRLPFCPYCTIVVAEATIYEDPVCFNCHRTFMSKQNEDGSYTTKAIKVDTNK